MKYYICEQERVFGVQSRKNCGSIGKGFGLKMAQTKNGLILKEALKELRSCKKM